MAVSPVEQRIALMTELWLEATSDPAVRVVVWRVPDNADRMLLAFFEAQRLEGVGQAPDLFIRFDAPFETGFAYSRALNDALLESYVESRESFQQQGIALDWPFGRVPRPDSAAGFAALFASFAAHHQAHFRHAAAVLMPGTVTADDALERWVRALLAHGIAPGVRVVLVQSASRPRWDGVLAAHPGIARAIDPPIDMFDIARETAAQAGSSGPAVAYRQLLTDVLTLVEKGTPAQAAARADKALAIAEREAWFDQRVVLHMAVAGAHLKAQEVPPAIHRYREARAAAEQARAQQHPAGDNLVMQTWFGEAGAWLVGKQPRRAADAYRSAAEVAQRIPNRMFAIEGFRMAAYCHAQEREIEPAREFGALALREGKALPPDERAHTTLHVALHDLLRLQDAPRAAQLEKLAATYQAEIAAAHADAESAAETLGASPSNAAIDTLEARMHARFEAAFATLRDQRERTIGGGDVFFRKVVAIARELLHAQWAGLPEVMHPLDQERSSWTKVPQAAVLPAAGEPESLRTDAAATQALA
jgi:hypothetical protein